MKLENKKLLITGADGFIGSHLVETLANRGFSIRALVQYNSIGSWGWLEHAPQNIKKSIEVVSGDIRDPYFVEKIVEGCEVIFHLAALIAIPYSYHAPDSYVDVNIKGTLNIVNAARKHKVTKVVHTSTSEVYGTAIYVPIDEKHPLQGQSPYSASKIGADQIAMSFFTSFNVPVAIIRPFNTYGPRQSSRAVIPTVITQIAKGETTIKLGSLTPTRDFNYVQDTVDGFISIAESDKTIGEVTNVGSGFEISVGDLVTTIASLFDKKIEIVEEKNRLRPEKSEVMRLLACNNKAHQITGWKPNYSNLEGLKKGLKNTIDWFTDEKNLNYYKTGEYTI
jgi:NAD dependent epimerase/dehydratase